MPEKCSLTAQNLCGTVVSVGIDVSLVSPIEGGHSGLGLADLWLLMHLGVAGVS